MKKIIFSLLILLMPVFVYASETDYDITDYYIDAKIEENGDLSVNELIVLDGTFNGYIRDITYKNSNLGNDGYESNKMYNASSITMDNISAKKVNKVSFDTLNDSDFQDLEKNEPFNLGYTKKIIPDGESYKMYFKADDEKVAFKLSYTISDVAVLHNDIAEVYWTFIGSEYEDVIRNLNIKLALPDTDSSSYFRVWAHGNLDGEIKPVNNEYIMASVKRLNAYSPVDIRTTFDKSLLDNATKKNNEKAFESILEVEEQRALEANQKREEMKKKYHLVTALNVIFISILILIWIYVYLKYDKEYKNTLNNDYYREFIDDYNVEVIDYLFHKNITSNALTASIMNLVYKKNIKVEELPNSKKKKDYEFTLINQDNLKDTEKYLLAFLFETVGKNNKFTTIELKNYAKSTKTCDTFSSRYNVWKNKVISDGKKENFYENKAAATIFGAIILILSILIISVSSALNVENPLNILSIILGIIFFIYTLLFNKRTKRGSEHYYKWKAFKKFLLDFGDFSVKELPEINLWERYMVYATIFGIADQVAKSMNVKISEMDNITYMPTFTDFYVYNSINNSVNSTISANQSAITSKSINNSSSGSGFGGGFSSGGGFGGGGGGGHGF